MTELLSILGAVGIALGFLIKAFAKRIEKRTDQELEVIKTLTGENKRQLDNIENRINAVYHFCIGMVQAGKTAQETCASCNEKCILSRYLGNFQCNCNKEGK